MNAIEKLRAIQQKNRSIICLGLDLDPKKMPADSARGAREMYDFVIQIVDASKDLVCAYKPNMAFFERRGSEGMSLLRSIVERLPEDVPVILDGKRGDIGNTATFYAEALYDQFGADWVTINPYMGYDSMRPFIERADKGVFVLCLTSNPGSRDFQHLICDGKPLYQIVAEKVAYWNKDHNCGLVVGATHPDQLKEIREFAADMPLLIPGVGAQGGSLEEAALFGTDNFTKPAVINVSRSVLYASREADFAQRAREELLRLNQAVAALRKGRVADEPPGGAAIKLQNESVTISSPPAVERTPDSPESSLPQNNSPQDMQSEESNSAPQSDAPERPDDSGYAPRQINSGGQQSRRTENPQGGGQQQGGSVNPGQRFGDGNRPHGRPGRDRGRRSRRNQNRSNPPSYQN